MIHKILKNKKLVLASESPRRKLLLEMLGVKALVIPARIAEPLSMERAHTQAMRHARNKAETVRQVVDNKTFIIAADTIVCIDGINYGKPESRDEAVHYLRTLSGRSHNVYTGLCLISDGVVKTSYERSKVYFQCLTEQEIQDYIETGEPFDKAGAYGIQGFGAQFVRQIQGCYFNVMGFPVSLFYRMLTEVNACL